MPQRIQLRRTKGWRLPPGAVNVARPTAFGNPFTVAGYVEVWNPKATPEQAADACARFYRDWLREVVRGDHRHDPKAEAVRCGLPSLRGKDLACWCKPGAPCHADVLIEYANRAGG